MEKIIIEGGKALEGTVRTSGSKNSALPILASTILSGNKYQIENVPEISDVFTMLKLLETLGAEYSFKNNVVLIDTVRITKHEAPYELVKTMRASVLIWGSLLSRLGKAKISFPGGCAIGDRPVDQHLNGFDALGYQTKINSGYLESVSSKNTGGNFAFEIKSVTGTENLILCSVFAKTKTMLSNCAMEPEIDDLINFLNSLGAKITRRGGNITISPVSSFYKQKSPHVVIPDRIEAGTFLFLGCIPGNKINITNCAPKDLKETIKIIKKMGAKIETTKTGIKVTSATKIKPLKVETNPHPLFPTDLQAQLMAVLTLADGKSTIVENVFPNRFIHIAELRKLGAKINLSSNKAEITGVNELIGANMQASDLRASSCLLISALSAKGKSEVHRIYHLDRGYESINNKLKIIGANIWRTKE